MWDDEPVAGAVGSISASWDDDEAWVFAYEIQRVVETPAPTSDIRG